MAPAELAVRTNGAPAAIRAVPASTPQRLTMDDIWTLAENAAASRLFPGITTPQAAFSLMMICESEGLHPMQALRRFDVIEGRPSLKAAAIQAEFIRRGGRITPKVISEKECRAIFSHPELLPDGFEFSITFESIKNTIASGKYGVKDNYKNHTADMLWWRLVSKAIRKIDPGIVVGMPSTEEAQDEAALRYVPSVEMTAEYRIESQRQIEPELNLPGQTAHPDPRPYHQVVSEAVTAVNERLAELASSEVLEAKYVHAHLMNRAIQADYWREAKPSKVAATIEALTKVYRANRDWLRHELAAYLATPITAAEEAVQSQDQAAEGETPAPEAAETEDAEARWSELSGEG